MSSQPTNHSPEKLLNLARVETRVESPSVLPLPEHLEKYERIYPGLANRMMALAEKQQTHRHQMELRNMEALIEVQNKTFNEARLGQIFALLIGTIAIGVGGLVAFMGSQWTGSIIGGGGVIGLVSVFIYGRKKSGES